jgi:hypothetical protein
MPATFSQNSLLTYLLRDAEVLVELLPPHIWYVKFRDNEFLQDGVVNPAPNPQPGGPGYLSYSGTSLKTSPAWVALPAAMLQPA